MKSSISNSRTKLVLVALTAVMLVMAVGGSAWGQTNPTAQTLPYTQDFGALAASSTTYPAGWQGWVNGTVGGAYLTSGPTADQVLTASSNASTTAGGVHNYSGKVGPLNSGTNDFGIGLAINATGASGVVVRYEAMTIRNPYDGTTNTRINEIALQYRVGTTGAWTTLAGTEYQNNTTAQTGAVVTPQQLEYRSVTLPADCDNQAVVQLRWAQREVSGVGSRPSFAIDNVAVQQPPAGGQATALQFDGSNDYVTFGQASPLAASNFTIETWFRRTGAGTVTQTGGGGSSVLGLTNVVPLVAKGRGEGDGGRIDCNYFLGIQNTPNVVLAADYEHDASSNNNHAFVGTTVLQNNVWYHAALTYDGATLKLYLNGNLEAQLAATPAPRSDLIQHAGLATAMTSVGAPAGYFAGMLDEARIWNVARSACDIVNAMNLELASGTGLIGRWGMGDGAGVVLGNTIGNPQGILVNGPTWVSGAPFNLTLAAPTALSATAVSTSRVDLAWTDNASGETSFEIERSTTGSGGPFSLLTTVGANTTSYSDLGLTANAEYCYQVRALQCTNATGYTNVACATTPLPSPPADPTNLVATAPTYGQVHLTWTDNSTDETGFELERSTSGSGGPFSLVATLPAGTVAYDDLNRAESSEYCYRVRAVSGTGQSNYAGPQCATTPAATSLALDLGSASAYAGFGNPAALKLSQFTIEMWMRRDGAGAGVNTGTGGIPDAIPLLAKGMADAEVSSRDINYLFGIKAATNVLCADFEEDTTGASKSLNHPILGSTAIPADGQWRHVAVTYDGTWKLYLNGALDAQLAVGQPPGFSSNVPVALGRALILAGTPSGAFDGATDEVRVWSVARTIADIQSTANVRLATPQPNLVARWSLDEGSGTFVNGSAGTALAGTISGTGYSWIAPAPFDLSFAPPAAPSGLSATGATSTQVNLAWMDNSSNESGFEIERSTTGIGGTYSLLATVPANTTSYSDGSLTPSTEYCYQVRATNAGGPSDYAGPACATTPAFTNMALDFAGSTYVTFGDPDALDLPQFTVECWFKRDGIGTSSTTGSSGVADAVPLVAHGAPEADGSTVDMNFMLGFTSGTGVLCADFEEGAAGSSPGLNHPITGATPVGTGWHHAAATYDGSTWKLYLDGILDAANDIGQPVRNNTTQRASLATMLTSGGATNGFFDGRLDEVRIWNYARTQAEIRSTANLQLSTPETGLVARWSLDEGSDTVVNGSAGTTVNGTVTGANYTWVVSDAGFNLTFNEPPLVPVLVSPADNATGVGTSPTLQVQVTDPEGAPLTVTYYGRALNVGAGPDFTVVVIPDAQYYTAQTNGGTIATLDAQNNWTVANRVARNIVYAVQLGDCTDTNTLAEWERASTSFGLLENPVTTGLTQGLPYGVSVGNHDQTPNGNPTGTANYNATFGEARFSGRTYYGGHYGSDNDNWYEIFSASGMDFIVISLEYDPGMTASSPSLVWADNLLTANPDKRAIVVSHFIINTGNPGGYGPQGQVVYNTLRTHPNLFLMLCGHVPGEGRRQDVLNGTTVHTLLSDYQSRTNGGNGWMRILEFSPANDVIRVRTYSPTLGQFEADADSSSQFTLAYPMTSNPAFQVLGTTNVASGSVSALSWPGLTTNTQYEWYVRVSDGTSTTTSPVWSFTTQSTGPYTLTVNVVGSGTVTKDPDQASYDSGTSVTLTANAATGWHFTAWSGDLSGSDNPATIVMNGNKTVTATFAVNPGVGAVANLRATQVRPGTLGEQTTPIEVTWDATPPGTTVEVWRKGFGAYPEYDDGGGATPSASSTYPPGTGWAKVDGLTSPGGTDLVAARDFYFYVAYARDGYGTWSPTSAMTAGTLNYHLADVSNGVTAGTGDNQVYSEDVSLLGAYYGRADGDVAEVNYLDVGPTTTSYVDGRPTTDNVIDFEDLVMFAMNHGLGHVGAAPLAAAKTTTTLTAAAKTTTTSSATARAATTVTANEVLLEAPNRATAGGTVTARLTMRGTGALIALSTKLTWDPAVVEPASHQAGEWLAQQDGQAFSATPGTVDAAVMRAQGLTGEGELATVTFRVLASGDPKIGIEALDARDARNRKVEVTHSLRPVPVIPLTTQLAFARPNPFRETVIIPFSLAVRGPVELVLYSVDGRRVRTLVNETREPGEYEAVWDGRDENGNAARAGVYYLRMVTPQGHFKRTVTNLR